MKRAAFILFTGVIAGFAVPLSAQTTTRSKVESATRHERPAAPSKQPQRYQMTSNSLQRGLALVSAKYRGMTKEGKSSPKPRTR